MDQLIDFAVVVLPTGIALLSVLVSIKLTKGEPHKGWWWLIVVLGLFTSGLTWVSQSNARKQHDKDVGEQKKSIDALQATIQINEIRNASDMGYLKAKLEDAEKMNDKLSKFAPLL